MSVVFLNQDALNTLRDMKRRVYGEGDSSLGEVEQHSRYHEFVVFRPTSAITDDDGCQTATLKYPEVVGNTPTLVELGDCYAVDVNNMAGA
jgi:hypothetical protein